MTDLSSDQSHMSQTHSGHAGRVDWVDIAKGICIILVVMMHATLGVEKVMGQEGWMHTVIAFAKPFRMPDFFLLSGLFLAATIKRPWKLYFDRKVVHFAYFYVLWFVIQFGLKAPFTIRELGIVGAVEAAAVDFLNPHSTLWFIYMLPILFLATRVLRSVPPLLVFAVAALLQILPVHTGIVAIDQFAAQFVYFFAGYAFAPLAFKAADWAMAQKSLALQVLLAWALLNAVMVFTALTSWLGDFADVPARLPVFALALGFAGAGAIILTASLLNRLGGLVSGFLRHAGENSIAIYLAFFFPMGVTRSILVKFVPQLGAGWISLIVLIVAVVSPLILLWMIRRVNFGHFLFRRPDWAITAYKPGEERPTAKIQMAPAE